MPLGGAGQLLSKATYLAEPRPRTSRFAPAPVRDAIPAGFQQKNNHRKVVTRLGWSETACGEQNHLDNICGAFLRPKALPDISSSLQHGEPGRPAARRAAAKPNK